MKTRKDLCDWITEALLEYRGSASIKLVRETIWKNHDEEIRNSGNFLFTWQDDMYWAATQLRSKGILKNAQATSKSMWSLTKEHDDTSNQVRK